MEIVDDIIRNTEGTECPYCHHVGSKNAEWYWSWKSCSNCGNNALVHITKEMSKNSPLVYESNKGDFK